MIRRLGYARVSTAAQDPQLQHDALAAADCARVYTDIASGATTTGPSWQRCWNGSTTATR